MIARVARCCARLFLLAVMLTAVVAPVVIAGAQPTSSSAPREPVDTTTIKVVPLTYARAGELAYTLSLVFPHVRIVPYHPTNSRIISGPRTSVEELIDIIKPENPD
jgi:hypothetical protein